MNNKQKVATSQQAGKVQKITGVRMILSLLEIILQALVFLSFLCMIDFCILGLPQDQFLECFWVFPAVAVAYFCRKWIHKFALFLISHGLVFVLGNVLAGSGNTSAINMLLSLLICAFSIALKNRMNQQLNADDLPVREGQSQDDAVIAAMQMQVHKEEVSIYFIGVMMVGYVVGSLLHISTLTYIELFCCILFIILQIIYNNLSRLNQVFLLNQEKSEFPAHQLKQVTGYITVATTLLIMIGMLIFYQGEYGGIVAVIMRSFKTIGWLIGKFVIWILGIIEGPNREIEMPEPQKPDDEEEGFDTELQGIQNPLMEAFAEAFAFLLVLGLLAGVIYLIVIYVRNFNRTRRVGKDVIESVRSKDLKEKVYKETTMPSAKLDRTTKTVRKMYRKQVLKGTNGEAPNRSFVPSVLTKETITENEQLSEEITRIYEKARYSNETITENELEVFRKL